MTTSSSASDPLSVPLNVDAVLPEIEPIISDNTEQEGALAGEVKAGGQGTAKKAVEMLTEPKRYEGFEFRKPEEAERKQIAVACALKGVVVYGKAFDLIKITSGSDINFLDHESILKNWDKFVLCEVKSTSRKMDKDFQKYFFSLTTAELLVAQSLGDKFRFVFFHIDKDFMMELSIKEVFAKARAIYPTWSIQF